MFSNLLRIRQVEHSTAAKDKIMGLYKSFKGKESEAQAVEQNEESFNPIELEQAFDRAYRSYRINGRSKMDVDTFFDQIRQNLINLVSRELTELNLASVQTTTWIGFRIEYEKGIIDSVRLPFNSQMTDIFQGSDLNEIVNVHSHEGSERKPSIGK